jgi:hypothetical protein
MQQMGYELHFKPKKGTIDHGEIEDFFRNRPHYTEIGDAFYYENDESGVTFRFEVYAALYPVTFRMSYHHPDNYISEAEKEISGLVEKFDFLICDPQSIYEGDQEYDKNLLLGNWKAGNAYTFSVAATCMPERTHRPGSFPGLIHKWLKFCQKIFHMTFTTLFKTK